MAGLAENGRERGKAQIGFGGVPVRWEDQHHLHPAAAGGFELPAIEENQLLGGSFALGIFDFHSGLPALLRLPK